MEKPLSISTPLSDAPLGLATADAADDLGAECDAPQLQAFSVALAAHGKRLDQVLSDELAGFSRTYLQTRIQAGDVQINGLAVLRSATRVHAGQHLQVLLRPTEQSRAFRAQALPLTVLFEDAHLLVIDKPAGLVVHPAPGHWSGTLMNALLARDARAFDLPRAGIVHRLDKDTSGLLVVARTRPAMDALVAAIARRDVKRQYGALAHGAWTGAPTCSVDAAIGRDPKNRLRMAALACDASGAKSARTDFTCLASRAAFCWVGARLHTGRTHQIRVHLASLGHPLVADALYGGAPALGLTRQALHAHRLALAHPISGQALSFTSPWPADLCAALTLAGLSYNQG